MITYGLIALFVGLVLTGVGFSLHLVNMKNIINGANSRLTGGRMVLPFALLGLGGLTSVISIIVVIIGVVLLFL